MDNSEKKEQLEMGAANSMLKELGKVLNSGLYPDLKSVIHAQVMIVVAMLTTLLCATDKMVNAKVSDDLLRLITECVEDNLSKTESHDIQ